MWTARGLGYQVLFSKIIPHPWLSFPVFCSQWTEREGCRGLEDVGQLSTPALYYPSPRGAESHVEKAR